MIRKTLLHDMIVTGIFLLTWLVLAQVNWVDLLRIDSTRKKIEEKLGKIFLETFRNEENEIKDTRITRPVDSLLSEICVRNNLQTCPVSIYIIRNKNVNAFAIPGSQIVLFTGLIEAAKSPEELCGVLCHELAHIEKGHVMKKLIKEVGLNALISMSTSGTRPEVLQKTAGLISSTAYDRNLESEADSRAVELLTGAEIDPRPFAGFLTRIIADEGKNYSSIPWISTHPDSGQRAENILNMVTDFPPVYRQPIQERSWNKIKKLIEDQSEL